MNRLIKTFSGKGAILCASGTRDVSPELDQIISAPTFEAAESAAIQKILRDSPRMQVQTDLGTVVRLASTKVALRTDGRPANLMIGRSEVISPIEDDYLMKIPLGIVPADMVILAFSEPGPVGFAAYLEGNERVVFSKDFANRAIVLEVGRTHGRRIGRGAEAAC